jgi:putative redox protein
MKARIQWKGGMKFLMDAKAPFGEGSAATPKELLLMGLAGCTGMDVVDILRKARVPFDKLDIEAEGEQVTTHPMVFKSIHIRYIFSGINPPLEKAQKAVGLSQEKYCSISAMLKRSAEITYEIVMS